LSVVAVCSKVFGFGEKVLIAHFFGTGESADVYFAATAAVLSVVWLVRELFYPTLLPVFANNLSKSADAAGTLFRRSFLAVLLAVGAAATLTMVFSSSAVRLLVPGFSRPQQLKAAGLLRMLAPAMLVLSLSMVTYTVLNARKRFLAAAVPHAALKLFVLVGLLVLVPVLGLKAVALVLAAAAAGCILVQLMFIPERKYLFSFNKSGGHDGFKKVLLLMRPLAIGVVFSHVSGLADNLIASGLRHGQLSYLAYSKKIIDALLLIGPVALVTVVYSHLSHLASARDYHRFRVLVGNASRVLLYLTLPGSAVLVCLRGPLVGLLFERGRFGSVSTAGTSGVLMIYALGLATFSLEALLVYSFFAMSDTKTPVKYGVLCVLADIALAFVLARPFESAGIAAAYVTTKTMKTGILATVLAARLKISFNLDAVGFAAKLATITAAVWATTYLLKGIGRFQGLFLHSVLGLLVPGAGAAVTFTVVSYLLRIEEFWSLASLLRRRKAAVSSLYDPKE